MTRLHRDETPLDRATKAVDPLNEAARIIYNRVPQITLYEAHALGREVLIKVGGDLQARALEEAADDLYRDEGPGHMLSIAGWLRCRADWCRGERPL